MSYDVPFLSFAQVAMKISKLKSQIRDNFLNLPSSYSRLHWKVRLLNCLTFSNNISVTDSLFFLTNMRHIKLSLWWLLFLMKNVLNQFKQFKIFNKSKDWSMSFYLKVSTKSRVDYLVSREILFCLLVKSCLIIEDSKLRN